MNNFNCKECVRFGCCSYERYSQECQESRECEFYVNHSFGNTLYEKSDWDGGIGFDYIRNIKFCPICGTELEK